MSLTSPAIGAVFAAPANITLTANAADAGGTIQKVEFFHGGTSLIATVTSPPYTFNWTNVAAAGYTLTAKATDSQNGTTTSAPVNVTVNAGVAQLYFIHTDHLNTPRLIANQAAQVVWRWDQTDPFGGNVPDENPSGVGIFTFNLRFPGQYADRETGLAYNMARDYDPAIGRFIQFDPIGLRGGINGYAYVGSNPLSFTDPKGLAAANAVRCPLDPPGYQFKNVRIFNTPVITCIWMTDPRTGRSDVFCAEAVDQFTCAVTCVYQRVICNIPIPFITIEKPGECRVVDVRPS